LTDQEANEGKQVVLKCKINCTPPPQISWFKGGNEITKDPRVKTYKDPNGFDCLTINSASRGMAGEYEIKATNDMGTAACKCNIKVNSEYHPEIKYIDKEHASFIILTLLDKCIEKGQKDRENVGGNERD
jgi:Immunoglobulin I-set domain